MYYYTNDPNDWNFEYNIMNKICQDNNTQIAKWILQNIHKTKIFYDNDSYYKQDSFECACLNDNLEIAQLLYVNFQNDIIITDNIFIDLCFAKCYNIANWIHSLYPYLYVINDLGLANIRHKEEKNWQNRKYALLMASGINDKQNILYKIPEDVSRYLISNFL